MCAMSVLQTCGFLTNWLWLWFFLVGNLIEDLCAESFDLGSGVVLLVVITTFYQ